MADFTTIRLQIENIMSTSWTYSKYGFDNIPAPTDHEWVRVTINEGFGFNALNLSGAGNLGVTTQTRTRYPVLVTFDVMTAKNTGTQKSRELGSNLIPLFQNKSPVEDVRFLELSPGSGREEGARYIQPFNLSAYYDYDPP